MPISQSQVTLTIPQPATAVSTTANASATSAQLLAANAARLGASIFNNSNKVLYIKFGATASASDYVAQIGPAALYELPIPVYTGEIDGVWAAGASSFARVTELT